MVPESPLVSMVPRSARHTVSSLPFRRPPSSKTHLFKSVEGSFSKSRGPHGGAIPERNLARGGSPSKRDAEREKRFEAKLQRQAQPRGYKLVPIEEKPAA